jgi:HK97 gp10 family phage protein
MDINLQITGLEQVQRALADLPAQIVTKAYARALDRAAGVIAAEVEERAPERDDGLLKDSIVVSVEVATDRRGATATVGYSGAQDESGYPADLLALWTEYGHRMIGHQPGKKPLAGPNTPDGLVVPHPFMRPAFEASSERAIEVFQEVLVEELGFTE